MLCHSNLLRVLVVATGWIGVGLLIGCATDRSVIDNANKFNTDLTPALMNDPPLQQYIQSIGNRIIQAAKEAEAEHIGPDAHFKEKADWMFGSDMQFHFVNSKTLNAFTTGGNHMYVYNELFQQCKTEDELAAVMSHEFAHVYSRHVQKGMDRQYAILAAAGLAGAGGYAAGGKEHGAEYASAGAGLGLAAGQFVGMSYTRKDEAQADEYGFDFYVRAGWDPAKFGDFFQHMIDGGYDKGSEMLSDHPSLKSRVDLARQRAAKLGPQAAKWRRPPVADASHFQQLQAQAREDSQHMPDDKSLANAQQLLAALPRSCLTPAVQEDQKQAELAVAKKMKAQRDAAAAAAKKG